MATILVAPNEDGFGPSSLAEPMVRELLSRGHAVIVRIGSPSRLAFNRRLYASVSSRVPKPGKVCLEPTHNLIELVKSKGRLDEEATLRRFVTSYGSRRREAYLESLPERLDLVIDIGVPPLVAAAARRGIPRCTVFDHRWSTTLRNVLTGYLGTGKPSKEALRLAHRARERLVVLAADEAQSDRIFLLSPPISAPLFRRDWHQSCSSRVIQISGAFGGPQRGNARNHRVKARAILGLPARAGKPAVLLSAGGTPVWDDLLRRLVQDLAADDRRDALPFHAFVFAAAPIRKRLAKSGVLGRPVAPADENGRSVERFPVTENVCVLGDSHNLTFNGLTSAFDWVVSRAGGGTVNDALACAVPLLLLAEPGHWQVNQVRRAVVKSGFGLSLGSAANESAFQAFWNEPAKALRTALARSEARRPALLTALRAYRRGAERTVVDQILALAEGES